MSDTPAQPPGPSASQPPGSPRSPESTRLARQVLGTAGLAILFLGGACGGVAWSHRAVPGSRWAEMIGFGMLPGSFIAAVFAWQGLGFLIAIGALLRGAWAKLRGQRADWGVLDRKEPPGRIILMVVPPVICLLAAFAMRVGHPEIALLGIAAEALVIGLIYGGLLLGLSRLGALAQFD